MILKNLLRRRMRTALTVAGVAIGVAAIVALGALSEGLAGAYGALSGGSEADLLVAQAEAIDIVFSVVDEEMGAALADIGGVREATGMLYTFAATEGVPYFVVFGYDPGGFAIEHFRIVEGGGLTERSSARGGRPIILGRMAADDLGKGVGDTIRLYESAYRVVGIYETGTPIEDGSAIVTLEAAQALSKHPRQVNAFLVKVRTAGDVEQVRQRIERQFDDVVVTLSSSFADEQDTLAYVSSFTWAVAFLAMLIGGIVVTNTLLMSVLERTRELGTLRAVGWQPARILGLILSEAVLLCGLGGVVGSGLGAVLVWGLQQVPLASSLLASSFSPALFVRGTGVALVLGLLGGVYPARRASRLLPAEAMRAESGGGARVSRLRSGGAALRNLLRQPMRTSLTLAGVGVAILSMVSMGGLAAGLVDAMTGMADKAGVHLVGMEAGASVDLSTIDESVVRRLAALPGVREAEGFLTGYTKLGDQPFFILFGYHPRGRLVRDFTIVEGEPLTANRQIIVGRVAAENGGLEVGQSLRFFGSLFRVVGIYETGVPFEDGGGVISLRDAQALFGQARKVSFFGLYLEDPLQAENLRAEIEARFPEVSVSQGSEFSEGLVDLQLMQDSTWAIAFLALLIGGAGMTNTMVMSVLERTREVGVLRALGWTRGRILGMIMRESLVLGALGGLVGLAAGVLAIGGLNAIPFLAGFIRSRFSPELFLQAMVTAFVLGVVGGIYPAWRASRMRPVEALRYE